VDDGSRDGTYELAQAASVRDARFKLIQFSRNFGHQVAITAGMDAASGDAVIIMDADLQDPPHVVLQMIEKWKEGYEVVYGLREQPAWRAAVQDGDRLDVLRPPAPDRRQSTRRSTWVTSGWSTARR